MALWIPVVAVTDLLSLANQCPHQAIGHALTTQWVKCIDSIFL